MIENTSNQYGPFDLPILGGSASAIERMEADGQRQLLESCDLPTKGSDDPEFLRLGFTFGEPHKADPLGRERVGVFYKAAFYDRRADMRLATVSSYVSSLLYYGGTPVLDGEWATVEAVIDAARGEIARERESLELWQRPDVAARQDKKYLDDRIAECRASIAKAEALIAQVTS